MDELELRIAWERSVADTSIDGSRQARDAVIGRYREPHRHYHTTSHLRWVVRHVLRLASDVKGADVDVAIAAAFYHDAVYDPRRDDNESASAQLARRELSSLTWPPKRCDQVAAIIEATAHHRPDDDPTSGAVLTADLAILASGPTDYADYVSQVRREYQHVSDSDWRRGRRAVVAGFAARSEIFDPRVAPATWEERARANLAAELAGLADDGGRQ